ncbi:uncharacterized protein LOC133799798 [Humulus lupulus]|uniref:uncharacterized protein LOC133799798 n=1 Tax=Humulus lupulus TaxID=3486 RepID=UPI002B4050A2|nr:uncharacterized protein LOC133799798 [Humulus lupulus]
MDSWIFARKWPNILHGPQLNILCGCNNGWKCSIVGFIFNNALVENTMAKLNRFMNQYFLLIACLQLWSLITPVNPASTWGPLIFIFEVSATKEAWHDYHRFLSDKKANEKEVWVVRQGIKKHVQAQDIHVGNIVWLRENDEVPCDLVLIGTSDPQGMCYVETSALDGETDLKTRFIPSACMGIDLEVLHKIKGVIECPVHDKDIRRYDENLRLFRPFIDNDLCPLTIKNTILQSCYLRNTEWACGVAVYTGKFGVSSCVKEAGIGFMMPPTYHPAMKVVRLVRKKLKVKTVFNILGPMLNPARVPYAIVGVYAEDLDLDQDSKYSKTGKFYSSSTLYPWCKTLSIQFGIFFSITHKGKYLQCCEQDHFSSKSVPFFRFVFFFYIFISALFVSLGSLSLSISHSSLFLHFLTISTSKFQNNTSREVVEHQNIANDLKFQQFIVYKPQNAGAVEGQIIKTIGFLNYFFLLVLDAKVFVPSYPKSLTELMGKSSILLINGSLQRIIHGLVGGFFKSPQLKAQITRDMYKYVQESMTNWSHD